MRGQVGDETDAVRELDAQHNFPTAFSHWLCIDLLSATARIAGQLLPAFPLLTSPAELQRVLREGRAAESMVKEDSSRPVLRYSLTYIVDVSCFYCRPSAMSAKAVIVVDQPAAKCPLPESWDTTSDSLAAWLASLVGASELVLFKSTAPSDEHPKPRAWGEQGLVDAAFADVLPTELAVKIVNLLEP